MKQAHQGPPNSVWSALAWLRILAFVGSLSATSLWSQTTIFVTRHADREAAEPDPALTPNGERRAEVLASMLADAGIKHIYATDTLRTRKTAAPTSRVTGVQPVLVPQEDFDGLIEKVRATARPGESTLVVGHRQTVPRIVKALSGVTIAPLGSGEFSRLIVVTLFPDGRSSVVTMRQEVNNNGGKAEKPLGR